jgi:hypothetical protein
MCDRFPCITRSIIPAPTDPIHSRLHLPIIIDLDVKILTNSNNLFGNPLYWTIFLLHQCIPSLIKVGRHGSQSINFCPLSQIKVGSFCFSGPVRRSGCGGLFVSTDCVRWRWCWSALLCATDLRCENRPVNRPVNRDTGLEMPCCPVTDLLWV